MLAEGLQLQNCPCYSASLPRGEILSVSESCNIKEIDDIGDVANIESDEELATAAKVIKRFIRAVVSCDHYPMLHAKLTCESDGDEYDIMERVKCQSKMVRGRCKEGTIGRVIVESGEKMYMYRLTVFEDVWYWRCIIEGQTCVCSWIGIPSGMK